MRFGACSFLSIAALLPRLQIDVSTAHVAQTSVGQSAGEPDALGLDQLEARAFRVHLVWDVMRWISDPGDRARSSLRRDVVDERLRVAARRAELAEKRREATVHARRAQSTLAVANAMLDAQEAAASRPSWP